MTTRRGPGRPSAALQLALPLAALLCVLLAASRATARPADERPDVRPEENLALGRPYTFDVWPRPTAHRNFRKSNGSHPDPTRVLTDGRFAGPDPRYPGAILFGRSPTGVAFRRREGVEIVVDLGAVSPIAEILVRHSSNGRHSLQPREERYLVSDDGRTFHPVARFVNDFDPRDASDWAGGKRFFRGAKLFGSGPLRTKGRFVMVKTLPAGVGTLRLADDDVSPGAVDYDEIVVRRGGFDPDDVSVDVSESYRPEAPVIGADVLGYRFAVPDWSSAFGSGPLFVGVSPTTFFGEDAYHLSVGGTHLIAFQGLLAGPARVSDLSYRVDLPAGVRVVHESPHWRSTVSEVTRDGVPYRRHRLERARPGRPFDVTSYREQPFFLVASDARRPDPALGALYYTYRYAAGDERFEAPERAVRLVLEDRIRAPAPRRFVQLMYVPRLSYRFPEDVRTRLLHFYAELGFSGVASGRDGSTYRVAKSLGMDLFRASHMCVNGVRFRNGNLGWYQTVPEADRFHYHPEHAKGRARYLPAMCPERLASPGFFPELVEEAKRELRHGDHIYVNWEPYPYLKHGCVCDRCRRAFREFAGLSERKTDALWPDVVIDPRSPLHNRFTSHQHGRIVRALQRATEEAAQQLGREKRPAYMIATSGEYRAGDERLRYQDPLSYASEVETIAIWGTTGKDAHAGAPSRLALVGQNLSDGRHRYVKQLLAPAMEARGSRHEPGVVYLLNPNTSLRMVFPQVFYFHTVLTFLEGWEGHGSFRGVGLDARYLRARAEAARAISILEDLVWEGRMSASVDARVASPVPALQRHEGRAQILYAKSYTRGAERLIALGNDGVDPIFVELRVSDLAPDTRSVLVDRVHERRHGPERGLAPAALGAGILIRVPPKEFAFLELRAAGADPATAGFEHVAQEEIRTALERETPGLRERATELEGRAATQHPGW